MQVKLCVGGGEGKSVINLFTQVVIILALLFASYTSNVYIVNCCLPQKLCTVHSVNCRDIEGRQSTPLHFAAGYNRVSVVEYLLQHGADVHAKDKG